MKYEAGLNGKRVEIEADSLWSAKEKAIAILKPKKKDMGLLWVVLAEQPLDAASLPGA